MVRFGEEKVAQIKALYESGLSVRAVAREVGTHHSAIARTLKNLDVHVRSRSEAQRKVTPETKDKIECLYLEGYSTTKLCKMLGLSLPTICRILHAKGVMRKPVRYEANHQFFDVIETEERAYWLGFVAADGNISDASSTPLVRVELQKRDAAHLQKFIEALESTHPLKERPPRSGVESSVIFGIRSKRLADGLVKHGVTPRKTFTLQWPEWMPENLLRHYMRGYFDGNGGWGIYPRHHRSGNCFFLTGATGFVSGYQDALMKRCALRRTKLRPNRGSDGIATLAYGGSEQVKRIASFLYEDSTVFLARKRDKVAHLL